MKTDKEYIFHRQALYVDRTEKRRPYHKIVYANRNEKGELNCEGTKPARVWEDGLEEYYINGYRLVNELEIKNYKLKIRLNKIK